MREDVGEILKDLALVGALRTEEESPEPEVVAVVPKKVIENVPARRPMPTLQSILASLDSLREDVLSLMEAVGTAPDAASAQGEAKPKRKKKAVVTETPAAPAPQVTRSAAPTANELDAVRARIRSKIRGEDLPRADEEEDDAPFVGSDRAVPDRSDAQHVMTVGGHVNSL